METKSLREQVIERRKSLKLTQAELAVKAGITQSQLSNFESGKSELNSSTLDKIFEVLRMQFSQSASELWNLSEKCAELLKAKGVKDASSIAKEEMAALADYEEILLLQVVSEKLYEQYVLSSIIDEHNTYNFFNTLVNFHLALIIKE